MKTKMFSGTIPAGQREMAVAEGDRLPLRRLRPGGGCMNDPTPQAMAAAERLFPNGCNLTRQAFCIRDETEMVKFQKEAAQQIDTATNLPELLDALKRISLSTSDMSSFHLRRIASAALAKGPQ